MCGVVVVNLNSGCPRKLKVYRFNPGRFSALQIGCKGAVLPRQQYQQEPKFLKGKPRLCYVGVAVDGLSDAKVRLCSELQAAGFGVPPISKSDAQFLLNGVEFVYNGDGIDPVELGGLFEQVGFPKRDPIRLAEALLGSYSVVWIRAAEKSRWAQKGQLIGFARAASDGELQATIWDVAVLPSWQRLGFGRALVERILVKLVGDGIGSISLYAEPNVVGMYQKLGFIKDPVQIRGMAFQRKSPEGIQVQSNQNGMLEVDQLLARLKTMW